MKAISSTDLPSIKFDAETGDKGAKLRAQSGKIAWIHSHADAAGARFDLVIKDSLGRTKYQRKDCGGDTERFGELVNLPTTIGEELDIQIENVRGAKKIDVFLN